MPFSNYRLPLRPGSNQAKTDLPRKSQRRRTAKPPAPSARSAPARLSPAFVYPETPSSLLLPITVELFPGDHPVAVTASPPSPIPEYDAAIRRLDACVADATLTTHQKVLLDAAMNTAAHCFGHPGMVHSLIHTIALPSTTVSEILDLVTVVGAGMRTFIAQSGPSSSSSGSSVSSSSARRGFVKTACAARDNSTCVVTGRRAGTSCHIVPFSVKGEKAENFWAFVGMFKGIAATRQLKIMTLGPDPSSTDNIRNVVWLSPDTHTCFDNGQLALVPVMASGAPYNPATVTEYNVRVELPNGAADVDLSVWTTSATGQRQTEVLVSGHTLTLRTSDPAALPLPHPIFFQLHTAFTRLRKMCASAGIPMLPDKSGYSQDYIELSESSSVLDYQELVMQDAYQDGPLHFEENNQWPVTSSGYPLKERYLQLLCGSEDSECEQYHNVIDHWTPSDKGTLDVDMQDVAKVIHMMPQRKTGFEQLYCDGSSASNRSRPVIETGSNKRWDSRWGIFGVFSGVGDGGSE